MIKNILVNGKKDRSMDLELFIIHKVKNIMVI